jgi:HD-GYP domain-containing protein (c-di-GMP phosphodiesterase class II)
MMAIVSGRDLARVPEIIDLLVDAQFGKRAIKTQFMRIAEYDRATQMHVSSVMFHCISYMHYCGRSRAEARCFGLAGLLHDIGKVEVPLYLLSAPRQLTAFEFNEVKKHADYGAKALVALGLPDTVIEGAYCHHERLDGTGYPNRKKASEINEVSRTLAIIDSFDALTTQRPYKNPVSPSEALTILKEDVDGGKLDSTIFEKFSSSVMQQLNS